MIIHSKLMYLSYCRNQFETKTSNGTLCEKTRTGWEDRLFNKHYHDAKPFDRVKYGCLNIVNDPKGVNAANAYGDSFVILKKVS